MEEESLTAQNVESVFNHQEEQTVMCSICYCDVPDSEMSRLHCDHSYCTECLHDYFMA